jgi:hypothetical protein
MKMDEKSLQQKLSDAWTLLDEGSRRLIAASDAFSLEYGEFSGVFRAYGLSRKAIAEGLPVTCAVDIKCPL